MGLIMDIFRKEEPDHESRIHHMLSAAFSHVKRDISHVFNWINYFHKKHQQHDERLARIEFQLQNMPKSPSEIKQVIDYYYSHEDILNRIQELGSRLDSIEQQKIEKKYSGRDRLVKKVAQNSKDYVKTVIRSMINKYSRISGPQLKEIVVEEQGLCSKSSFYRLLGELEQENEIGCILSGKEKEYFSKSEIVK